MACKVLQLHFMLCFKAFIVPILLILVAHLSIFSSFFLEQIQMIKRLEEGTLEEDLNTAYMLCNGANSAKAKPKTVYIKSTEKKAGAKKTAAVCVSRTKSETTDEKRPVIPAVHYSQAGKGKESSATSSAGNKMATLMLGCSHSLHN